MSDERSPLAVTVALATVASAVFGIGWAIFTYADAKKSAADSNASASASPAAAESPSSSASGSAASSPATVIVDPGPSASKKQPIPGPSPVTTTKGAASAWTSTAHWSFELSDQDDSPSGYIDTAKHDALLFHGVRQPTKTDMSQSFNLGIEAKWNQLNFPYYSDIASTSPTPEQCLNGGSDGTAQFAKGATPTYCRDMTDQNGGRKTVAFVKVTDSTNIDGSTPSVSVEVWFAYQS